MKFTEIFAETEMSSVVEMIQENIKGESNSQETLEKVRWALSYKNEAKTEADKKYFSFLETIETKMIASIEFETKYNVRLGYEVKL